MTPECVQRLSDEGDARNDTVSLTQLQWEAFDAYRTMLDTYRKWAKAATAAEPESRRYEVGCEIGIKVAKLLRLGPPQPSTNTVPLFAPPDIQHRPHWAG